MPSAEITTGCPAVRTDRMVCASELRSTGWNLPLASRWRQDSFPSSVICTSIGVAGTDAAVKLLKVADPESYYVQKTVDLDELIGEVVEKKIDFDVCFAFMHSDAGMTYAATFSAISKARLFAVVFGKNAEALGESIDFPAEKIVAKATHNPNPLKNKIDKVVL